MLVELRNQTITFGPLANKTYGDPDFTVSWTASSGLAVSFAASENCTVSGAVHLTGPGSCTVDRFAAERRELQSRARRLAHLLDRARAVQGAESRR